MGRNFGFAVILVFSLFSCAPSRLVKPLKKGEQQISASFGGPLIHFAGTVIPIPFTSVNYAKGISNKTSAFAGLHTTSALFGNFQTDLGIVRSIYKNDSLHWGISATPVINLAAHKFTKDFRCWPQLDINAYWNYRKKESFLYFGLSNWFELKGVKAHNEKQNSFYFLNPQLGHTFVNKKWNFNLELKFLVPGKSNSDMVVDYARLYGKTGATGIFFGATRKF